MTTTTNEVRDNDVEDLGSFVTRARAWVVANLPVAVDNAQARADAEDHQKQAAKARRVQRLIYDGGFAGLRYPKEYGGQALTREHQMAWREVTSDRDIGSLSHFKVTHGIMGPTLLDFGTEEQKTTHIPAMLRGDELWVQFLSEPSAGSDLASLLTRAQHEGDLYVINGSKIWSTFAHISDYALVLARTNVDVPKHSGLSMLILPIKSDGVTLRTIELAIGSAEFCEEFFDDVMVPDVNIVGHENDGWNVVMRLFFHERNMVGGNSLNDQDASGVGESAVSTEEELVTLVRSVGKEKDSHTRQLIGEALVLDRMADHTIRRVNALMKSGALPAPGASIVKLMRSLSKYRFKEIALEIGGAHVVLSGPDDEVGGHGHRWLVARIGTVAGGSSEMQRNAISERVLGLPRDPSPDTQLPFREVLAKRKR
jgi:alkylation response protein AidB-like acyl-CoA dehydrogenase